MTGELRFREMEEQRTVAAEVEVEVEGATYTR
jgi:hypothetical protein